MMSGDAGVALGKIFRREAEAGKAYHKIEGGFGPFKQEQKIPIPREVALQRFSQMAEGTPEDSGFRKGFFAQGPVELGAESESEDVEAGRQNVRRRRGQRRTILTGPLGLTGGEPQTRRSSVLG